MGRKKYLTMSTLNKVFEARRNAQEELRGLYDVAEGRALEATELETEARLGAAIADLQKRESNLIAMQEDEKRATDAVANSPAAGASAPEAKASVHDELRSLAKGERSSVSVGYEARDNVDLMSDVATDGAELVESELLKSIHDLMVETSPIMSLATVMRTAGGNELELPRVTSHSVATSVSEGAAFGKDSPQFDTVTVGADKYGFLVPVSRELEADSAFAIGSFVTSQGAAALGRGIDAMLVGKVAAATTGLTTAAVDAVTMDELISAQHSVLSVQRAASTWVLNDSSLEAIRKLKDSEGNYLWRPGAIAGAPDVLLGNPVLTDPNVAAMATGATFGLFGDFSGFVARVAGGVVIDRSAELYFANDMVAYRFLTRADGVITDTTGIRKLVNG